MANEHYQHDVDGRARTLLAAGQITMIVSLVSADDFHAAAQDPKLLPAYREILLHLSAFRRAIDPVMGKVVER